VKISSVVATAYGGPEVLSVVESNLNDPGPDEVVIEVRAAGTNPVDYKLYSGTYGDDPSKLPMSLGLEAAGVVAKIGGELEGPGGPIAVGDEVIVYGASGPTPPVFLRRRAACCQALDDVLRRGERIDADGRHGDPRTASVRDERRGHFVGARGAGGVGLMAVQTRGSRRRPSDRNRE